MPDSLDPGPLLAYLAIIVVIVGLGATLLVRRARRRLGRPAPRVHAPPVETPPAPEVVRAPPAPEVAQAPPAPEVAQAPPEVEAPPLVVDAPVAEAPLPPEAPARPTFRDRLGRARQGFGQALRGVLRRGGLGAEDWEEIEEILIRADVGIAATTRIVEDLKAKTRGGNADGESLLRDELLEILGPADRSLKRKSTGLTVWLVTGVNGTGKTTTIGKLARQLSDEGKHAVLAAADTFRAAADEQLVRWAAVAGAEVVKHAPGADPGAVAFDAVKAAQARGADVLIVDTAGRLHTKKNLMVELGKIRRIVEREAGAPDEVLLVLDATTGQNGIAQARAFAEVAGVTGLVLTKLDGTAKGGIVIAVQQELGLPVKLVGLGEGAYDLAPFEPERFVDALVGA